MRRPPPSRRAFRPALTGLSAALVVSLGGGAAAAHPHVFVTAKEQVLFDPAGEVTGVRADWTFDDMYSSFVTQGLGTPGELLTRDELAPLAKTNVESLAEFGYFTVAKMAGHALAFDAPTDYWLDESPDKLVTLHFTLPLKTPVKPVPALNVSVYDPTYFVDFQMAERDPVALVSGARRTAPPASSSPGRSTCPTTRSSLKPSSPTCRRGRTSASSSPPRSWWRARERAALPRARAARLRPARRGGRAAAGRARLRPGQEPLQRRHLGGRRPGHRSDGLDPRPAGMVRARPVGRRAGQPDGRFRAALARDLELRLRRPARGRPRPWQGGAGRLHGGEPAGAAPRHRPVVPGGAPPGRRRGGAGGPAVVRVPGDRRRHARRCSPDRDGELRRRGGARPVADLAQGRKPVGRLARTPPRRRPRGFRPCAGLRGRRRGPEPHAVSPRRSRLRGPRGYPSAAPPSAARSPMPPTCTARIAATSTRRTPRRSATAFRGAMRSRPWSPRGLAPARAPSWCWSSPWRRGSSSPASPRRW